MSQNSRDIFKTLSVSNTLPELKTVKVPQATNNKNKIASTKVSTKNQARCKTPLKGSKLPEKESQQVKDPISMKKRIHTKEVKPPEPKDHVMTSNTAADTMLLDYTEGNM
ncbi:unnamed protein product [Vicia faba]|uniref:Uncharacterized protein n=1 Tax=Vicia faba TaxID=3906 RepID=A0AAV1A141_VICFA|nr:unnamed protein product [Vicia faba]